MRREGINSFEPVAQTCRIYRHPVQIFQGIRGNLPPREGWQHRIGSLGHNDGDLFRMRILLFQGILEVHSLVAERTEVVHRPGRR
jgi:hypothetical protein